MPENSTDQIGRRSYWPHGIAVVLVGATFPLIWVGGLVTTYDAGMAVPDWPTTYGYNLFLYPISTWIGGPWDLFIEHGHRLLASLVGLITIGLVVATWRFDRRPWMLRFSLVCLALVISQGVLGGMRVAFDANLLARLHGCLGPVFLAAAVAAAVFTSGYWRSAIVASADVPPRFVQIAWSCVALVYMQIVLGAHLRHLNPAWSPQWFQLLVLAHLVVALVIGLMAIGLMRISSRVDYERRIHPSVRILAASIFIQLCLGAGAWRVKYYWPTWLPQPRFLEGYSVAAESMVQTITVTLHVAMGSFILAMATMIALRVSRFFRSDARSAQIARSTSALLEIAG